MEDARLTYEAIRAAVPGGMGEVAEPTDPLHRDQVHVGLKKGALTLDGKPADPFSQSGNR